MSAPEPPKGYRIIPREYLEAGNPLPGDALFCETSEDRWETSLLAGKRICGMIACSKNLYATAEPLPCFDSAPEHNPDNLTPEQVGEGWRLLREGERVVGGDCFRNVSEYGDRWLELHDGCGDAIWPERTYRRRVAPKQALKGGDEPCAQTESHPENGPVQALTTTPLEKDSSASNAPIAVQSGDQGPTCAECERLKADALLTVSRMETYAHTMVHKAMRQAGDAARIAELEQENEALHGKLTAAILGNEDELAQLRAQLAASEKDKAALNEAVRAIEEAPHGFDCSYFRNSCRENDGTITRGNCNCWKRTALDRINEPMKTINTSRFDALKEGKQQP